MVNAFQRTAALKGAVEPGLFTAIAEVVWEAPLRRVLDIAAGHGLFGIAIGRPHPEAEVFPVDWAAVLAVARGLRARTRSHRDAVNPERPNVVPSAPQRPEPPGTTPGRRGRSGTTR